MHPRPRLSVAQATDLLIAPSKSIVVIPNMGNGGDSLINHATYSLLRKRGLSFTAIHPMRRFVPDPASTYIVLANGALHGREHQMDRILSHLTRHRVRTVLFSATIYERDELLKSIPPDSAIVCREHVTFDYAKSLRADLRIVLAEDASMAIADGDADLPTPTVTRKYMQHLRTAAKSMLLGYSPWTCVRPRNHNGVFNAFRGDSERTCASVPTGNVDLSHVVSTRDHGPDGSAACASQFLSFLKSCELVRTNRLHVAIGCCLVGVRCEFWPNSYFKCQAVFEHSLRQRFARTLRWMGAQ